MLLEPGFELTLRPMRHPDFYERYRAAIRNTWTVEEVDFAADLDHLRNRLTPAERHLIERLVAFFATGDNIVANNVVLSLYRHVNSPEARLFLSRQLYEEAVHIQFYLTLLDAYLPDEAARADAFAAVERIPSIAGKADFCFRWMDAMTELDALRSRADRRRFLLNLICFAACVEGLFFFGAFAYVYFLRAKGLLPGLATGTNWVFRDESGHIDFEFAVVDIARAEEPGLWDAGLEAEVRTMLDEAVELEAEFARDVLSGGVVGLPLADMRTYLRYVADRRLSRLNMAPMYGAANPFAFMAMQDVPELANFFERRVSAYQVAVPGQVNIEAEF